MRIIIKNDPRFENKNTEESHRELNLEAMNVRLYDRLIKLWSKFEQKENDIYNRTMQLNQRNEVDHLWWPRAGRYAAALPPAPQYV